MKKEEWRFVVGYEGLYMVSNFGRIRSLGNNKFRKDKILKPGKTSRGYLFVILSKNGEKKLQLIHRLVWEAFNEPIPNGMQINHLNEEKTDNRLENLSLATPSENINWGTANKRRGKSGSKMVEQYTLDGTHICTWFSVGGIEKELGYDNGSISKCCRGVKKHKTAYGYTWKYR